MPPPAESFGNQVGGRPSLHRPPLLIDICHSLPAESLGNQVRQLTPSLSSTLGDLKPIRRCATDVAAIDTAKVCVIWSLGKSGG